MNKEKTLPRKLNQKRLHLSLLIFLVCLLFTFLAWDHYLNSNITVNRDLVSNLVLVMGGLFSASAGFLTHALETRRSYLEREVARQTGELVKRNQDLQQALKEINVLREFIPMCASCKKIRDDKGYWEQVELYIERHSKVQLTHGICQDCMRKLYPGVVPSSEFSSGGTP